MPYRTDSGTPYARIAKVAFFFNFLIFSLIVTQLTMEKKLHTLMIFFFLLVEYFFMITQLIAKKSYTILPQKELRDLTIFLYTTYIFHHGRRGGSDMDSGGGRGSASKSGDEDVLYRLDSDGQAIRQ